MVKSISNLSSVAVVGLDTAKNVFHVHCLDAGGFVILAKAVRITRITVMAYQFSNYPRRTKPKVEIDPARRLGCRWSSMA